MLGSLQKNARNVTGMGKAIIEAGKLGRRGPGKRDERQSEASEGAKALEVGGVRVTLHCCAGLMGANVQFPVVL